MSKIRREFDAADTDAQVCMLIWCLLDERSVSLTPEDIADMMPEEEDELVAVVETLVELSGGAKPNTTKKKAVKTSKPSTNTPISESSAA